MPFRSYHRSVLVLTLFVCGCAAHESLVGHWESVGLEGETLHEQDVVEMTMDFTADTLRMTTLMRSGDETELDRRAMPYRIQGDLIHLLPTSTEDAGTLRFRVRGDSLVLEGLEPEDVRDVRIRLVRVGVR